MSRNTILTAVALFCSTSIFAQGWTIDKVHSHLGFSIMHTGISNFTGSFKSFDAKMTSAKPDLSDAVLEMSADISSINTDNSQRDEHLKSPDFFDAAKYPSFSFKSKSIKKGSGKNYTVTGDLTLHGVTKPVTLNMVFNGTTTHPMNKKTMAGFTFSGKIKRSDFNLATSMPETMLGNDVTLEAAGEFAKD
ncbi:MAG: polyisoprenoid-binding protein [Chitinophagia bacterium]|nr:polyisoprenoid-binding protein [Chitinophagia bacterium]